MIDLKDKNISYLLISDSIRNAVSYLYSRDYYMLDIKGYHGGEFDSSVIAFTELTNDELRKDSIHMMEYFGQSDILVKYRGDTDIRKILSDGQEKLFEIVFYNSDIEDKSYIYDGVSFSIVEKKSYFFPKRVEDFKFGMVIELFSNNKWVEKKVIDPENEFNKIYNLMIKYNKVRMIV